MHGIDAGVLAPLFLSSSPVLLVAGFLCDTVTVH